MICKMFSRHWRYVDDLCDLFSIPKSAARDDFIGLVDVAAHFAHRGKVYDLSDIVTEICREMKMSKLVYWSRLKRAARPILEADVSTLRALGLDVDAAPQTVPALVRAIVEVVKDDRLYDE